MTEVACVLIRHDCFAPSFVSIDLDATNLLTYDEEDLEDPGDQVPVAFCFDTSVFADDEYTLEVTSTCPGGTTHDSAIVEIDNPGFRLGSYGTADFEYNMGELITLELDAGVSGLDVTANFSESDSNYTIGAESVTDNNDGTYTVTYQLSSSNYYPIGVYSVVVTLEDEEDRQVHTLPGAIRYAPNPTPRIALVGNLTDEIVFAAPPRGLANALELDYATLSSSTIRIADEVLLSMEVWSAEALSDDTLILRVGEIGGNGYIKAVVPALNGSCGTAGCYYDVEATLSLRPFAGDTIPATGETHQFEIGFSGVVGGAMVDGPPIPGPGAWVLPAIAGDYGVIGQLTYTRHLELPGNYNHPLAPQYGTLDTQFPITPAVDQELILADGCEDEHLGRTYSDGSFAFVYDLSCTEPDEAQMYFRGKSGWGYINVLVTDHDDLIYEIPFGNPFLDSNLNLVKKSISTDATEWGIIAISQQAIRTQRKAKEYLVGNSPVSGMPELHVRWEKGVCSTPPLAFYGSYVDICGTEIGKGYRSEWAMTHEFFHWFGHHFQVDQKGNGAKDNYPEAAAFGEGFATMMTSIATGYKWIFNKGAAQVENMDYSGKLETDTNNSMAPVLPYNLYDTTNDSDSGGWSWRTLWDFHDHDNGMLGTSEPVTEFDAGWHNPLLQCGVSGNGIHCPLAEMGDFDLVGDPEVFRDVIVGYLGGGLIAGNLPSDPQSAFYIDDRGGPGLDMAEFLDGAICRSNWNTKAEVQAMIDAMSLLSYDPDSAPTSCP